MFTYGRNGKSGVNGEGGEMILNVISDSTRARTTVRLMIRE